MKDTIKVNLQGVKMIAHRGVSGLERENTNAAFVAAGNRTYFGVETDVHRTADSRFIIIHDNNTLRVSGVNCEVEQTDLALLRTIQMTDLDGNHRADLIFPELSEYINLCKKYEKDCVLELKNHFEPSDIDAAIEVIRQCGWLEHTIFISFDLPNCVHVREMLPEQRVQYLAFRFSAEIIEILTRYHLDLDIYYQEINEEQIALCHSHGAKVNVWTVDDPEAAQRLANWGIDFITTNILE